MSFDIVKVMNEAINEQRRLRASKVGEEIVDQIIKFVGHCDELLEDISKKMLMADMCPRYGDLTIEQTDRWKTSISEMFIEFGYKEVYIFNRNGRWIITFKSVIKNSFITEELGTGKSVEIDGEPFNIFVRRIYDTDKPVHANWYANSSWTVEKGELDVIIYLKELNPR